MTKEEILRSTEDVLDANDICGIFRAGAQGIRDQAQEDKAKLGFNVTVIGRHVYIPRMAFIKYMGWEESA